jgi:signal recognition particle subunit SEC65
MPDLFVSHSTLDDAQVDEIIGILEAAGIETFVDHQRIEPGDDWKKSVQVALEESECGVIVLSRASVKSQSCQEECQQLKDWHRRLYVILIEDIRDPEIPFWLKGIQYVNLTNGLGKLGSLIDSIRKRCCKRTIEFRFHQTLNASQRERFDQLIDQIIYEQENGIAEP